MDEEGEGVWLKGWEVEKRVGWWKVWEVVEGGWGWEGRGRGGCGGRG